MGHIVLQADLSEWIAEVENTFTTKVDQVAGKTLTTNDYTTAEQTKLSGIEAGAEQNRIVGLTADGYTRVFSGDQVAGSDTDVFITTGIVLESGVDYLIEGYLELITEAATGEALQGVELQPRVEVDGAVQVSCVKRPWTSYDTTQHLPIGLKTKVTGDGTSKTVALNVYHDTAGFTATGDSTYRVRNCVLTFRKMIPV